MSQLTGSKRLLIGAVATAAVALGVGGVAYAAGDDPAPEQGYVTIEDSPGSTPSTGEQGGTEDRDCPEKGGTGGQEGEQGQGSSEQPTSPESSDIEGQA
jgi:hypothetical protein